MISEIEEDYERVLSELQDGLTPQDKGYRFKPISEDEILALLRDVMSFQRKIEQVLASVTRIAGQTGYLKRLEETAKDLLTKLTTDKGIDIVDFIVYSYLQKEEVKGIIPHLKSSHLLFLHNDEAYRRKCYCAYFGFKSLRSSLIELEEELRLISALTTYPIEKKTKLKQELVMNGFEEVAVSLEEAESNAGDEHFKDCVSRCRDAIEYFVASMREKETGEKTDKHFAIDLAKIVNMGIFDESVQKLTQGVYSFTSLKGSHKYDATKVTVFDAETAMKEAYSIIEMLTKKYLQWKKETKG